MKSPLAFLAVAAVAVMVLAAPQPAPAETMFAREMDQAKQQHDKEAALALDPVNRRYHDQLEAILRRSIQGNDLDTAFKIKGELARVTQTADTGFAFVKDGSATLQPKGFKTDGNPPMNTEDPGDVFKGKPVYFNNHTGKEIIYDISSRKPITKLTYRGVAFFDFSIQIKDGTGSDIAKTKTFNDGNHERTVELPLPGLHFFTLVIRNEKAVNWTLINEIKVE